MPLFSRRMLLVLIAMTIAATAMSLMATISYSQETTEVASGVTDKGLLLIGAGIAAGLAALGAGLGLGTASAAAIGAIAEKPELLGKTLIYIVLIEAIAIYGLAMFFVILPRL